MARKTNCPSPGPNKGYLVSFGDTMTALLAFFIVLNSLAEEQTGANLHTGTGSFVHALKTFGVPGIFSEKLSAQAFQSDYPSPMYVVPSESGEDSSVEATGPDDVTDRQRVIDWEQEEFQRFLHEVSRWNELEPEPSVDGEVAFDLFGDLKQPENGVSPEVMNAARQLTPLLRSEGYELEIVAWATTPSESAWKRALEQSTEILHRLTDYLRLADSDSKLTASARPWESSTSRRPTVSLIMRRLK